MKDFAWQRGYGVFSVSASKTDLVSEYIKSQQKHHKIQSFEDEYLGLLKKHRIIFDKCFLYG